MYIAALYSHRHRELYFYYSVVLEITRKSIYNPACNETKIIGILMLGGAGEKPSSTEVMIWMQSSVFWLCV